MANSGTYNRTKVHFAEGAAAATPDAAEVVIYAKADGLLYSKDDAGTETLMSGGAAAAPWNLMPYWGGGYHSDYVALTANQATYVPAYLPGAATITGIRLRVGTQSGNICVGLYDGAGARVATSGSVACPAAGLASVAFTGSYAAAAGRYYLAYAADNATATFSRMKGAAATPMTEGSESAAFPLPASATISANAATMINIVGLVSGGFPA